MKELTIILMILIAIISCEEQPVYKKEGWTKEQFQPEVIAMSKATIDGNPIILSIDKLIEIYGEPEEIRKDCYSIAIRHRQGKKFYDCWIYDSEWNIVFRIDGDQAFLGFYKFDEKDAKIETPQITLSKNTSFKEIKKTFPIAYAHRNIGANLLRLKGDNWKWVYLKDDLPAGKKVGFNQIELIFKEIRIQMASELYRRTMEKLSREISRNGRILLSRIGRTKSQNRNI